MQSEIFSSQIAQISEGDNMDLIKKFLILLAIFCVIGSAAAVSAEDFGSDDISHAGDNYGDSNGIAGSPYGADDEGVDQVPSVEHDADFVPDGNPEMLPPDWNHMEHAAGEPDNQTSSNQTNTTAQDAADNQPANETAAGNAALNEGGNDTSNATGASPQKMPTTGNPILALFAVGAVLGGSAIIRRK